MASRHHLGRALALAVTAVLAFAATAAANTQQWSEPDETVTEWNGKELDLQSVTISQNATEALFETEIEYPVLGGSAPHDQVQIFVDTNADGNADRAVGFVGLSSGSYTVEVREVTTSSANCQRLGSALYTSSATPMPSPDGAGRRLLEAPLAARRMGAHRITDQADTELAAAGARPPAKHGGAASQLTPSELRIARMASDGMKNREIAQSLFVTVKAVEWHLANAYRKLEISGRGQLRAALSATDSPPRT